MNYSPNQPPQQSYRSGALEAVDRVKREIIAPNVARFHAVMPEKMTFDEKQKVVKHFMLAFEKNPSLATCAPDSIFQSMLDCAETGLLPNTFHKHGDLIRYKNSLKFVPQYHGLIHLARKTANFKTIRVGEICPNDEIIADEGYEDNFKIKKNYVDPGGEPYAYYACYETHDGVRDFRIWSRKKVEEHGRKNSTAFNFDAWQKHFDEMAKKTVLKNLLKMAPTVECLIKAVHHDNEVEASTEVSTNENPYQITSDAPPPPPQPTGPSSSELEHMVLGKSKPTVADGKKKIAEPMTSTSTKYPSDSPQSKEDLEPETPTPVDDYVSRHQEIYSLVDRYLSHPAVNSNVKLLEMIRKLRSRKIGMLAKEDLAEAIRSGLQNDMQALDSLLKGRHSL